MKIIAYLLYGNRKEYKLELLFSIISALRFLQNNHAEILISVITDQNDFDPILPIDQIRISQDEFAEWTLNGTFNHRAKMLALIKALDHYQAPVVFMDTDTFFVKNPIKLFERVTSQTSVMHRFESDQPIRGTDYWRPIFEKIGEGVDVDGIYISQDSPMFNSGVVGVDVTHRWLLEKAIGLTDELCTIHPIHTIEQFSLGLVLNQYTKLLECEDIVKHYWDKMERGFIHLQISRLLDDFSASGLDKLPSSPNINKIGYPPISIQDHLVANFLAIRYKWNDDYKFSYLAYRSALSYSTKDNGYANQWAKVALHMIRCGISNKLAQNTLLLYSTNLYRDFSQFGKDNINALKWMDADVKKDWLELWEDLTIQLCLV